MASSIPPRVCSSRAAANCGVQACRATQPSLIQVLTVTDNWNESTLTWNNAPLPAENVAAAWVDTYDAPAGTPGIAYTWDVSGPLAAAYARGEPLRLALYSADTAIHSGKYFYSSDTDDWGGTVRPSLTVTWGDPVGE